MIVRRSTFKEVVERLRCVQKMALDTETTGLRPWHGDKLFSLILADSATSGYYFNFQAYEGLDHDLCLSPLHLRDLKVLFSDASKYWYMHNAKYDLSILWQDAIEIHGTVHCTKAIARVEYNDHHSYTLDSCLKRIGLEKDDAVEKYIKEHKLYEKRAIPGKATKEEVQFYNRVPFDIITQYGIRDATGTYSLGERQTASIEEQSQMLQPGLPPLRNVFHNERDLTKTVFRMERVGVRIDKEYCVQAASFETDRSNKAAEAYRKETGRDYKASNKDFEVIFASEKDKWVWGEPTKTGQVNPSFDSDTLKKFINPAAKNILELRDAKSKADFYYGFIYHSDSKGDVHPNFNPDGARHGRFSSSNPNFQNLTSEDILVCKACKKGHEEVVSTCEKCGSSDLVSPEFLTRRAIIPHPGYIFVMPDYDQMEYRKMFELACRLVGYKTPLVELILSGKDPHQATADLVTARGTLLTRSRAKNGNFATLYGAGLEQLAFTIGGTVEDARALRQSIFAVAPEVKIFINAIMNTVKSRGYVFNWYGRKNHIQNPNLAYKGSNYIVSGGCADVVKIAMNRIDAALVGKQSRMVMTVHDELPTEVHESEIATVPRMMNQIMQDAFPSKFLPLTAGMEWSAKNLADKTKGYPV